MGVKTTITLQEARKLFPTYEFKTLQATSNGIMDTTYISESYVLKRYERDIKEQIQEDSKFLIKLKSAGLNVPSPLANSKDWYLYERLQGYEPKNSNYFHIQALARFMAKMHSITHKFKCKRKFLEEYNLNAILDFTKKEFFSCYKNLEELKGFTQKNDGLIHGDIFKDNTLFQGSKIGVFDFIDSGCGEFSFDIAVALVAFNPSNRHSYTELFLNTYNQKSPKKISKIALKEKMKKARKLYALLRIDKYKNTQKAKELL